LLAWFLSQALGPHLIGKAWDLLTNGPADWRKGLAKDATEAAAVPFSWRRVYRWLGSDATWPDLVNPSQEGGERLVASLAESLKPWIVLRPRGYAHEQRRLAAEKLVGEVGARFLESLDGSLATAVAHYREMRLLTSIASQTAELVALARVRQDKDERLSRLPPAIGAYVATLVGMEESSGLHLLEALTESKIEPARIVPELTVDAPPWVDRLPPLGWLVMADFAAAFEESETASGLWEKAANLGAPDRPRLLAKAAGAAHASSAPARATELLDRARGIAHGVHPFVEAQAAALAEDAERVVDAAEGVDLSDDVDLAALVGQAHAILGDHTTAIHVLRQACDRNPGLSSVRLLLAEHIAHRARGTRGVVRRSDLAEAFDLAIEARDLRRRWRGDSPSAVAVACGVAGMLGQLDLVLTVGVQEPEGQARPAEADDERVLSLVVLAATSTGDVARATATVEKISDPFMKALSRANLAEKQGHTNAGDLYMRAWDLARADHERVQVQVGLAELGTWPLPGHEELEASSDGNAAWILATAQVARGDDDAAATRLLGWRNRHLECANLLAMIRQRRGDIDGSVQVLRDASQVFGSPEPLIGAAQMLASERRFAEAEVLVSEAMPEARTTDHRRALLEVLAGAAQDRHDWVQLERHARHLVELDPSDADARWLVVGALYNQRRFEDAWSEATLGTPLEPTSEERVVGWIDLRRRFDPSVAAWRRFLDLQRAYPESEDVHAAVIIGVFLMKLDEEQPSDLLQEWNSVRDDFFVRYPNSDHVWQIHVGTTPEEMVEALRPILRAESERYETMRADVSAGRAPCGVLALLAGRPYALALAATAAGCHVTYPPHPATAADELTAAKEAVGGRVVADASVLNLLSYAPDQTTAVVGAFDAIQLIDATIDDIRVAADDIDDISDERLGWNLDADLPLLTQVPEQSRAEALKRVAFMKETVGLFTRTGHPQLIALDDLPHDTTRLMSWLGPLDYAKHASIPLYSDDAALRAMARAVGVSAFGSLAVLQALEDTSRFTTDLDDVQLELRRRGFVDLPPNAEHIKVMGDETSWVAPSPASFAFTRAAMWTAGPDAASLFLAALHQAHQHAPESLPGWLSAGIYGAGEGQGPLQATQRAVLLLLQALSVAGADPSTFAQLAAAARDATAVLDIPDPVEITLRWLFARATEDQDPQVAGAFVLHIASKLEDETRQAAARIVFGL
jgi:tetratricopeptide (TPR) repeat protein